MRKTALIAMLFAMPTFAREDRFETGVRRASADEVRALLAADVKTLGRLWSDDFVVTNPLNQFVTKRQVLALIASDTLAFTSYSRRIEYIRVYGPIVVVAGSETVIWAGRMPAAGRTSQLRFTAMWIERGGRWQEVIRHANIVSSPPAAGDSPMAVLR